MILTNKYNMPDAFCRVVDSLIHDPNETDLKRIGVTTLINPPRIKLLTTRYWDRITEDVSDHIWRISGSAIHYVLEKVTHKDYIVEKKIEVKLGDFTLVAKLDLYDAKDKSIQDYKFTSTWSAKFKNVEEFEEQLNCYAFALSQENIPVEKAYINMLLKDWRRGELLKYNDYPPIPFVRLAIKIWPKEKQIEYINKRIELYKTALVLPDDKLPLCSPKERWVTNEKYAIYKNSNKTATKVCSTILEAEQWIKNNKKENDKMRIECRPGEDMRCQFYCSCASVCPYAKEKYGK